jgi:cob(I)alamin adenosyltransferase
MRGLVHIYTGNGKGKTTTAVGLGIRAYGSGLKVLMVQFLKSSDTGEMNTIKMLEPGFVLHRTKKIKGFYWNMNDEQKKELKKNSQQLMEYVAKAASSGEWDMVILDEIMGAISNGLVEVEQVIELIKNRPEKLEVVMTGRNAPEQLIELANYVSEINAVKHPMDEGIPARKGIEY